MLKAIIYIRKSTESDDRQAQSLSAQEKWCEDYCVQHGFTVVEKIIESKSAKQPGREGFNRMLGIINESKIQYIVSWDLSRLCRNPIDQGTLVWMTQQGIIHQIHSTNGIIDGSNILLMNIHFGMSNQFIVDLRKNVKRGMQQKIEKGVFPGLAPLGYKNNRLEKSIEIDMERKHHILRIFEMRADGMTSELITSQINKEGLTTRRGGRVSIKTIEDIMKNPFYYGFFRWNDELFEGNHTPIISKSLFDQANNKSRGEYTKNKELSYLKGIVKHKETGKSLCCSLLKKKYIYHHLHGDSGKLWINENIIFEQFENIKQYYILDSQKQDIAITGMRELLEIEENSNKKEIEKINRAIASKRTKLKKYTLLRADDEIDSETFKEMKDELIGDITELKTELNEIDQLTSEMIDTFSDFVELLRNVIGAWSSYDNKTKGYWLSRLAVELKIDNQKRLYIEENDLFKNLRNNTFNNWSGGPGLNWHTQGLKP